MHLCCSTAGVYNLLQSELANRLCESKIANIEKTTPDVIVAGCLGGMMQVTAGASILVVHPIELADWVTGEPASAKMERTRMIEVGSAGGSNPFPVAAKPQL